MQATYRNIALLCLLLPLAACGKEATAATPKTGDTQVTAPRATSATGDSDPAMVVLSVRHHISGIHYAHVVTNADGVYVRVRRVALTSGFQTITTGTQVSEDFAQNGEDVLFTTTAGYKYMVVAVPVDNNTELPAQASTFELTS